MKVTAKENKQKKREEAQMLLPARIGLTFLGGCAVYLLIATHFLLLVKSAHFLGDPNVIPPSVLSFTDIFFRSGEISALIEIIFLVIWILVVLASCAAIFFGALMILNFVCEKLLSDRTTNAVLNCFSSAFFVLLPVLILSLLTLLITPLSSPNYHSDSPAMSEIAGHLPFRLFLNAMDEGTIALFAVALFVTITLFTAFYVSKILPDSPPMFFVAIFAGVIVGTAILMLLLPFGAEGFALLKRQTGNSYLAHFALFAVYSLASAVFIFPLTLKKKKTSKFKTAAA